MSQFYLDTCSIITTIVITSFTLPSSMRHLSNWKQLSKREMLPRSLSLARTLSSSEEVTTTTPSSGNPYLPPKRVAVSFQDLTQSSPSILTRPGVLMTNLSKTSAITLVPFRVQAGDGWFTRRIASLLSSDPPTTKILSLTTRATWFL